MIVCDGSSRLCSGVSRSDSSAIGRDRRALLETPLNETKAFSVMQETLFWLNSAIRVNESSGILKLFCESSNSRGSSLPIVAFLEFTSVVTQLESPSSVHCDPVYPLVQTQEHISPLETLTPPFMQGVVFSHFDMWFAFCRGTTTRKMGRRMASTMAIVIKAHTSANTQGLIPQQRRRGLPWSVSESLDRMFWRLDFLKKTGHDEWASDVPGPG